MALSCGHPIADRFVPRRRLELYLSDSVRHARRDQRVRAVVSGSVALRSSTIEA